MKTCHDCELESDSLELYRIWDDIRQAYTEHPLCAACIRRRRAVIRKKLMQSA